MGSGIIGQANFRFMGVRISEGPFVCNSMEIVFQTEQSVCIDVDGRVSRVSARLGTTVYSIATATPLLFTVTLS